MRRLAHMVAETLYFVKNHASHLLHIIDDFKVEVEGGRAVGFIACIMPDVQVAVLQGFFHANTRRRVKGEHSVEQVKSVRVGVGE